MIQLAPLEWPHWKNYRRTVNDAEVARLIDRYLPVSELEHQDFYRALLKDKSRIFFSIQNPRGKFIGVCALKNIDSKNRKAELYICLHGSPARGKGYGAEAVKALLRYAFDTLNLNRVYLYTPAYNAAALRCYRSVGFVEEGRARQDLYSGGRYHDSVHMAFLRKLRAKTGRRK